MMASVSPTIPREIPRDADHLQEARSDSTASKVVTIALTSLSLIALLFVPHPLFKAMGALYLTYKLISWIVSSFDSDGTSSSSRHTSSARTVHHVYHTSPPARTVVVERPVYVPRHHSFGLEGRESYRPRRTDSSPASFTSRPEASRRPRAPVGSGERTTSADEDIRRCEQSRSRIETDLAITRDHAGEIEKMSAAPRTTSRVTTRPEESARSRAPVGDRGRRARR
jgi:hypothetical protein